MVPCRHDHVGHMAYPTGGALCDPERGGCGAEWVLQFRDTTKGPAPVRYVPTRAGR